MIQIYLIVCIVIAAIFGWSGYTIGGKLERAVQLEKVERAKLAKEAAEEKANLIATRFESQLANLKLVNTTINQDIRREIEKTIYTACKLPPSGRVLLDRAVGAANDPTKSASPVPANPAATGAGNDAGKSSRVDGRASRPVRRVLTAP